MATTGALPSALPSRRLQWLAEGVLALGCVGLDPTWLLGLFTLALVLLAGLKLREARDRAGRRLVALLQLVACGLLAAQQADLLPSLQQLLAALLSLAGLLQLECGLALAWPRLLRRSLRVMAAALPVALVLFLLVPRVGPFGHGMGAPSARASTGLSDDLDPGSIATLVDNSSPAGRVAFSDDRPPPADARYWRVLVHPRFDGRRWQREAEAESNRPPIGAAETGRAAAGPDQVWLVEPSRFTAVPWDGRAAGSESNLRRQPNGELRLLRPAHERRSYRLVEQRAPQPWQSLPPRADDLALPPDANPRLQALGRSWAALGTPRQRVQAAEAWFRAGGFRYSTRPGTLPAQDGLDHFLFADREGFCGHYASAFSALMRAAGVPSRVVSGYLGGAWVEPVGGAPYLELRQSNAHAWSEVWLGDGGWQRVDPSGWTRGGATGQGPAATEEQTSPWRWLQRQWWGLDMAWSRWWLGFDRAQQDALLRRLLGEQRWALGWLILGGTAAGLGTGLLLHRRRALAELDRPTRDLQALLQELARLPVVPSPGETLEQLAQRASALHPHLADPLAELVRCHAARRFARPASGGGPASRQRWQAALRELKRRRRGAIRQRSGSGP
jgi:transglutaminase-like putative cysteine protease